MLCEELGISYDYITVDLLKGQHLTDEFRRLNPNGKVPVIDDDGYVLWESHAIMRYLADKHQANDWYPKDIKTRAHVDQWLDWAHTRLATDTFKIAFNTLFAGEHRDQQAIDEAKAGIEQVLPILAGALQSQEYFVGTHPTLADLSIATNIAYLEMCRIDLGRFPEIVRWLNKIKQLKSFAATAPQ